MALCNKSDSAKRRILAVKRKKQAVAEIREHHSGTGCHKTKQHSILWNAAAILSLAVILLL